MGNHNFLYSYIPDPIYTHNLKCINSFEPQELCWPFKLILMIKVHSWQLILCLAQVVSLYGYTFISIQPSVSIGRKWSHMANGVPYICMVLLLIREVSSSHLIPCCVKNKVFMQFCHFKSILTSIRNFILCFYWQSVGFATT